MNHALLIGPTYVSDWIARLGLVARMICAYILLVVGRIQPNLREHMENMKRSTHTSPVKTKRVAKAAACDTSTKAIFSATSNIPVGTFFVCGGGTPGVRFLAGSEAFKKLKPSFETSQPIDLAVGTLNAALNADTQEPLLVYRARNKRDLDAVIMALDAGLAGLGEVDTDRLNDLFQANVRANIPVSDAAMRVANLRFARLKELLSEMSLFTASEVAKISGDQGNPATVRKWAERGLIFSVEISGQGTNTARYPSFQFDEMGRPWPVLKKALPALSEHLSDWSIAKWFFAPRQSLGNKCAAESMHREEKILDAVNASLEPLPTL